MWRHCEDIGHKNIFDTIYIKNSILVKIMTRNLFLRNIYRFYDTVMISVLINMLDITQNLFLTYLTLYPFHIYAIV